MLVGNSNKRKEKNALNVKLPSPLNGEKAPLEVKRTYFFLIFLFINYFSLFILSDVKETVINSLINRLCNACGLRYYRKNKSIKIAKKKIAKSPSPKSKNGHVNITRLPSPPSPADSPSSPPSMNYDKINSNSNMENESAGVLANISSSIPSHPFLFTHKLYSQFNNQIFNQSEPMKFPNLSNSSDILNFNINISTEGTYHSKCNFPSYPNSNSISLPISIDKLVN